MIFCTQDICSELWLVHLKVRATLPGDEDHLGYLLKMHLFSFLPFREKTHLFNGFKMGPENF